MSTSHFAMRNDKKAIISLANCLMFTFLQGPGCKTKCETKNGQPTYTYAALFLNKTHSWPKDLLENMHLAGSVSKKYGTPRSLDTERPVYLHLTLDYYCCYTENEAVMTG